MLHKQEIHCIIVIFANKLTDCTKPDKISRTGAVSEKKQVNNKSNGPAKSFNAILQSNRKRPAYSITPIGIFAALLQFRTAAGYTNPIKAYRHEIMKIVKISGPVTCHRCIRELNDYGYINYLLKRNRIRRA